jgi:hypothetical protein
MTLPILALCLALVAGAANAQAVSPQGDALPRKVLKPTESVAVPVRATYWALFGSTQFPGESHYQNRLELFDNEIECLRGSQALNEDPNKRYTCGKLCVDNTFSIDAWNRIP